MRIALRDYRVSVDTVLAYEKGVTFTGVPPEKGQPSAATLRGRERDRRAKMQRQARTAQAWQRLRESKAQDAALAAEMQDICKGLSAEARQALRGAAEAILKG